jgi:hypothetical protein
VACRKDLHVTTHNYHERQTSINRGGIRKFNPLESAGYIHLVVLYYKVAYTFRHISIPSSGRTNTRERMCKLVIILESFSH